MNLFVFLQGHPNIFLLVLGILGALLGSFLNVVIFRLPQMLQAEWQAECNALLANEQAPPTETPQPYNLWVPRSQCTHCETPLCWWQNIPVLSFIFLHGKCFYCKQAISPRYIFIEIFAIALAVMLGWYFGYNWEILAALVFTFSLLTLSVIDIQHHLLPDAITQPLLWVGLLISLSGLFCDTHAAILGATIGYGSLWTVAHLFKYVTGKEGMGHGDFKLFAALGAWLGWQALPFMIICASVIGLVCGITFLCLRGQHRNTPIPFGPFLAIAGCIALFWGDQVNSWYLNSIGF